MADLEPRPGRADPTIWLFALGAALVGIALFTGLDEGFTLFVAVLTICGVLLFGGGLVVRGLRHPRP